MADLALSRNATPAAPGLRFDASSASGFIEKSVSDATRQAYRTALTDFFSFAHLKHPQDVTPADVAAWRDDLRRRRRKPATVAFKLAVVRSFFEYLRAGGQVALNPASTRLVSPPALPERQAGRALTPREARLLLAGPDRSKPEGARDYALLLALLRLGLRVSEVCGLKSSHIAWSHGRWVLRVKVKGGRERALPLPPDVKQAVDAYLKLDAGRRRALGSGGAEAFVFQPHANYRTLVFDKPLTRRHVLNLVRRWGDYTGVGELSPHDLRRTAITRALDQGLSYRQVQMMSGHRDPKTVMRYDHSRENLEQSAVNFLTYADDQQEL